MSMARRVSAALIVALTILVLAGCGKTATAGKTHASTATVTSKTITETATTAAAAATTVVSSPTITPTLQPSPLLTTTVATPARTVPVAPSGNQATMVVNALHAAGLPVTLTVVYTAASDPNHLLGRPGQYTAKVAFEDARVKGSDPTELDAIDNGGSVEVFATAAQAAARITYIQAFAALAPEYDYQQGGVLLRVSHLLTPDQAKAYATALAHIHG